MERTVRTWTGRRHKVIERQTYFVLTDRCGVTVIESVRIDESPARSRGEQVRALMAHVKDRPTSVVSSVGAL